MFAKAAAEVRALEARVEELARIGRVRDLEIARRGGGGEVRTFSLPELGARLVAREPSGDSSSQLVDELVGFNDWHQNADGSRAFFGRYGDGEEEQTFVGSVGEALRVHDANPAVLAELLRLSKTLLRERREACRALYFHGLELFLARVCLAYPPAVREEAIKCMNNCYAQFEEARAVLFAPEHADRLLGVFRNMTALLRSESVSHSECQKLLIACKGFCMGEAGNARQHVAQVLIQSDFLSAMVERAANALLEAVDQTTNQVFFTGPVLSTTFEGASRASVLSEALRLMYVVAVSSDVQVVELLKDNGKRPTLAPEVLEACDLAHTPDLGVGDRYVFLQTRLLLAECARTAEPRESLNLDAIKAVACSLLMFADKAPGFTAYLYRRNVASHIFALLDRLTTQAKKTHDEESQLLPLIMALNVLISDNDDLKEQFQELFLHNILPPLDAHDFPDEESFRAAKDRRHFAGRSIPDTTFGKVVGLLTSFSDHVKRLTGEFLYCLFDDDANKVTHYVGMGHAAHILAIKGGMIGQIMAQQEAQAQARARQQQQQGQAPAGENEEE